jgi:hypothetical protein
MRTNATIARLPVGDAHDRPATTCIHESVQRVRPIEAWLTDEDARRLREHLARCETIGSGIYPLLGEFIRAKLADAAIGDLQRIGSDTAIGYSRVIYAVDGLAPQSQVLSHWRYPVTGGFGLPICTFLGATLLGMKAGQRSPLLRADGTTGTVELLGITYRPKSLFKQRGSISA